MTIQVSEVAVRFARKLQPQQYEPVEAEVSLKGQVEEKSPADIEGAINELMGYAKHGVYTALDKATPGRNTQEVKVTTAKGEAKVVKAETKKAPAGADSVDTGPAKTEAPKAEAKVETPKAEVAKPAAAGPVLSVSDIQKRLAGIVAEGKLTVDEIKAIYPKFKVFSVTGLKEDQTAAFSVELDALLAAKHPANPGINDL